MIGYVPNLPRFCASSDFRLHLHLDRARDLSRLSMLALVLMGLQPLPTMAKDSDPFGIQRHEIPGLIHQVWPLAVSRCGTPAADLLVLSTVGPPPTAEKRLTWMPCGSALVPGDPRIVERVLPPETALIDVALLPGRTGPQLIRATAAGLTIESLGHAPQKTPRSIPIPGGLPLPDRPWDISRISIVDDWQDLGPPMALVPGLRGAWLVALAEPAEPAEIAPPRLLPMPVYAAFKTKMPDLPETVWKWMIQETFWPNLARADDNGDGRLDLFALSRWAIWIYHSGPDGLPSTPSRKIALTPFDEETERDHEATITNYFARDIDGDAKADLLLSTVGGGLSDGRSTTRVFLNSGSGTGVDGDPIATRTVEGGFSGFAFVDFDGDGLDEILETTLEFGIVQIVRVLLTSRAETTVRLLGLDPNAKDGIRVLYEEEITFKLDFSEGVISGLVPSLGDWNGDGVMDFYLTSGDDAITFQMGSKAGDGPRFGSNVGRQEVPLAGGQSRIRDIDGDGLDEIIAFSTKDPDTPLIVFENLGRLPGTRPSLDPAD